VDVQLNLGAGNGAPPDHQERRLSGRGIGEGREDGAYDVQAGILPVTNDRFG
jgi:hypothetical protein